MRLTELEPQWLERDGQRVGVMFRCPHCRTEWLTCFWVKLRVWGEEVDKPWRWAGQMGYIREALDRMERTQDLENAVVPCDFDCLWNWNGGDFNSMTITPSLDASKSGHWHGHITDGAIR